MEKKIVCKGGEVIIKEGEYGKGFYILQSGHLDVTKGGVRIASIAEPGTIFGEMSALLDEPRTCTITAAGASEIVYIPKGIDDIVISHPTIARKLLVTLAKRLQDTTEHLWQVKAEDHVE
jgi:CRP/FNR family transcriptional regulator, cyclic AMP receptor protein